MFASRAPSPALLHDRSFGGRRVRIEQQSRAAGEEAQRLVGKLPPRMMANFTVVVPLFRKDNY
jgi:hypothetical protein